MDDPPNPNYTQRLDRLVADIRDEHEDPERDDGEDPPIRLLIEALVLAGLELLRNPSFSK